MVFPSPLVDSATGGGGEGGLTGWPGYRAPGYEKWDGAYAIMCCDPGEGRGEISAFWYMI